MTTDSLAQSLVEAAASAICRKGDPFCSDGLVPAMVLGEAREAAAAVVEKLADSYPNEAVTNATPEDAAELYALAAAIREGR